MLPVREGRDRAALGSGPFVRCEFSQSSVVSCTGIAGFLPTFAQLTHACVHLFLQSKDDLLG